MKYFSISVDPENCGKREMVPRYEYDVDLPRAQAKLSLNKLPQFEPNFSKVYIDRPTPVLDDYGAIGGMGFIMERDLIRFLDQVDLCTHQVYPLETLFWGSKEPVGKDYSWLQLVSEPYMGWIEFKKSAFELREFMSRKGGTPLEINNKNNLKKAIDEAFETDFEVICTKLNFGPSFPRYDIFFMEGIVTNTFPRIICSERLKEAFENRAPNQFIYREIPS